MVFGPLPLLGTGTPTLLVIARLPLILSHTETPFSSSCRAFSRFRNASLYFSLASSLAASALARDFKASITAGVYSTKALSALVTSRMESPICSKADWFRSIHVVCSASVFSPFHSSARRLTFMALSENFPSFFSNASLSFSVASAVLMAALWPVNNSFAHAAISLP